MAGQAAVGSSTQCAPAEPVKTMTKHESETGLPDMTGRAQRHTADVPDDAKDARCA